MYNKDSIMKKEYNDYWVSEAHFSNMYEKRSNTDNKVTGNGNDYWVENNNNYYVERNNNNINSVSDSTNSRDIPINKVDTSPISSTTTMTNNNNNIDELSKSSNTQTYTQGNSKPTIINEINTPSDNNIPNSDTGLDDISDNNGILSPTVNNTYGIENPVENVSTRNDDTSNVSSVFDGSISQNKDSSSNNTIILCIVFALLSILIICTIIFINKKIIQSMNTKEDSKNVIDMYQDVNKEICHNNSLVAYQNLSTMRSNSTSSKCSISNLSTMRCNSISSQRSPQSISTMRYNTLSSQRSPQSISTMRCNSFLSQRSPYNIILNIPNSNKFIPYDIINTSNQNLHDNAINLSNENIEITTNVSNNSSDIPKAVMSTYQNIIDTQNLPNENLEKSMSTSNDDKDISKSIIDTYQEIIN